MRFLILLRRKERVWEQFGIQIQSTCFIGFRVIYSICYDYAAFCAWLGIESAEYLDMTSRVVFVHCTVEEGKSIFDRILSVTPLEDLQIKALLISEDEPIITFSDASDISALLAREELLQLIAPGIGSENEIEDPTPFPLSI
jgi:hypothetical protein